MVHVDNLELDADNRRVVVVVVAAVHMHLDTCHSFVLEVLAGSFGNYKHLNGD